MSGVGENQLISIQPDELKFLFELEKQSYCDLKVANKTENYVAFKMRTTFPKMYFVRPNTGVMQPRDSCIIRVTLQAQREYPPDMQCRDKFLLQSTFVPPRTDVDKLPLDTFTKDSGKTLTECKLKVSYIYPSTAQRSSESGATYGDASGSETISTILRLKEERDSARLDAAVKQTQQVQHELEMVKRRKEQRNSENGLSIKLAAINMEEYSHNLEKNLEDLEMEVETLNTMINELLRRMTKEKDRGLQTLLEVEEWISMAEDIESKASSLLDESIMKCHDLSTYDDCSKISESTLHYIEMVCMTLKEVETLRSRGVFKELVQRAPLSHVKKILTLQPIVSQKMLLEKAWKCLTENGCRILGLYGMAGVGKTTLLTWIKNKFIEDGYVSSSLVLFVAVESDEVESIQVAIMERLGLYMGRKDKEEKAFEIYGNLNKKKFVLLLDGIQRKVDLEEIGVPELTRGNGCKIVYTTRSEETCKSMQVDAEVEVKCLSPEEAWDFFQGIVGETTLKSHPDIPQLARIVARKCGGLPIALSLISETMCRKSTVREWHHAIHVLVSSTIEFSGTEAELLPILKFTYDNLPGENIKSCFLYCALFPENYNINKQDLVDYWIAEGMIEQKEDREIAEFQGYEMIGDLVRMRLLMDNESGYGVKMHGMVREMALWIASDFGRQKENFVVLAGVGIHQMPEVNDWRIVKRMSVTSTHVEKVSKSPDCPELTTLFLQENNFKWVSSDFFRWMTSLVVLNLSHNRELCELPEEVSSLVSLQLLNLSCTWIKRLPFGLKELKRLIHLDLDDTPLLREIDVIGYLVNLQVLRLFRSVPIDLSLMEDIQLLKSLKDLSLTAREVDVLKRLLSNHQLASCIGRLHLTEITITNGGILLLNSMLNLRELDVGKCGIQEITINWRTTIQRETVHFGNIEKIPHLQNIRTVTLSRCRGLRDLTWLLLAPNLGDLKLHKCRQIENIISKEKAAADTSEQPFQNLTRLSLDSLPKLESIYWAPLPFPILEYLYVRGCPKLRRLPFNSDFDQESVKGVKREKEATKQHLSNLDDRDFPKMAENQKIMDGLASESHPIENIDLVETSKIRKSTTANSIIDFDDRDFPKIAENQKMDGLARASHPIENMIDTHTPMHQVSSFEMSPSSDKIPPSPFRAPPSPSHLAQSLSRYAMYPRPRRMGPLNLSMSQIAAATNNFSHTNQIGEGCFGKVYKGILDDGQVVAIKRAKKEDFENEQKEFKSEVGILSNIGHRNLVKLLGYVDKGDEPLVINEYVGNGTLRDHLDGARGSILNFIQRLEIAIDVCIGLTYLHSYAERQIIHGHIKSSNILLTDSMRAKVADFGFARCGLSYSNQTHTLTQMERTIGYLDPEYVKTCQLTAKTDVYSFGILLVEILTGRSPVEVKRRHDERITVRWAFNKYNEGKVFELVDSNARERVDAEILWRMFSLAFECAAPIAKERPDMEAVAKQLWGIRSRYLRKRSKWRNKVNAFHTSNTQML